MSSDSQQPRNELRIIRERLFAQSPLCHWCKRTTELPPYGPSIRVEGWHATVDHLFARGHPLRGTPTPGIERHVLACARCNTERSVKQGRQAKARQVLIAPQFGIWAV